MARAVAILRGDSRIKGTVTFEQETESSPITLTWDIAGSDADALRGLAIHTYGDGSNGLRSAGPHFNPYGKTHGAPTDEDRHVGDLGNVQTDGEGNARGTTTDSQITLFGPNSVIGRMIILYDGADDLGSTDNSRSKEDGNAGKRIAGGIIGIS